MRAYRNEEDAIKKAIEECIGKGILAEYLIRKGGGERIVLRVLASTKSIKKTAHILDLDEQTVADIAAANPAIAIDDRETD